MMGAQQTGVKVNKYRGNIRSIKNKMGPQLVAQALILTLQGWGGGGGAEQRQADLCFRPTCLHSKFQASQSYTVMPFSEKEKTEEKLRNWHKETFLYKITSINRRPFSISGNFCHAKTSWGLYLTFHCAKAIYFHFMSGCYFQYCCCLHGSLWACQSSPLWLSKENSHSRSLGLQKPPILKYRFSLLLFLLQCFIQK